MADDKHMPDIDAGLNELATETTAAELMRGQGQRKKLKVINEKELKGFVNQSVERALHAVMADRSDQLEDSERQKLIEQAEQRVQEAMRRAQQAEAQRAADAEARQQAEQRLQSLADEHTGGNAELQAAIRELQERLARAETAASEAQQDLLVVEEDLDNTQKMLQSSIAEKDKINKSFREHFMRASEVVQGVMNLDNEYYGNKHQNEDPVDENADPQEQFYHEFGTSAAVIATLSQDLARLRDITAQKEAESGAPAAPSDGPKLLAGDLALLEQLKSGSLDAMDVAAPVEGLVEALEAVRAQTMDVRQAVNEVAGGEAPAPLTALPEADGDPARVLAGATHVVRELAAALAAEKQKIAHLHAGEGTEKSNSALREQMIRTSELVQGVLQLDADYYGSKHQEENPVAEEAEVSEIFYHDFSVGAKVIETLAGDLARLREITAEKAAADAQPAPEPGVNLIAGDLALLEQLKSGSLNAVDVAAPVEGLVEALDGARNEAMGLDSEAAEAMGVQVPGANQFSVLPDPDGEPAQVLAGATTVIRELATAFANERRRLAALRALADDADDARNAMEEDAAERNALADAVLASLAQQAAANAIDAPSALTDSNADPEARRQAAQAVIESLKAVPVEAAPEDEPALDGAAATQAELLVDALLTATQGDPELDVPEDVEQHLHSGDRDHAAVMRDAAAVIEGLTARRKELADQVETLESERDRLANDIEDVKLQSKAAEDAQVEAATALRNKAEQAEQRAAEVEQELEQAKNELAEANELAESAKEMLGHFRDKAERFGGELDVAKAQLNQLQGTAGTSGLRLQKSENASRRLAEQISDISRDMIDDAGDADTTELEQARVELEVVMSEIPEDSDIPVRDDLSDDIADAAVSVLAQIRKRQSALQIEIADQIAALAAAESAKEQVSAAQAQAAEGSKETQAELDRVQAKLHASEQNVADLSDDLAAKTRSLSEARENLASTQADLAGAKRELEAARSEIAELKASGGAREELEARIAELEEQLATGTEVQEELAQAIGLLASLTTETAEEFELQPRSETQRITRSKDKLAGSDGEHLATNAKELAAQVAGISSAISDSLREQREHAAALENDNTELRDRLSHIEAGIADKDHRISTLDAELAEIRDALRKAEEARQQADQTASEQQELLRQSKAALDEYRARQDEAQSVSGSDLESTREQLEQEQQAHEEAKRRLAELEEEHEGAMAGLRRRAEELDQRIADRDETISRLEAELDSEGSRRIDTKELEAKISRLQSELEQERSKRGELEQELSELAGGSGRMDAMREELDTAHRQRDEAKARVRQLEGELSEERGRGEAIKTSRDKMRADLNGQIEEKQAKLDAEKQASRERDEELRALKSELAGLRAKVRSLTGN